jgi:hypothetical protein
MPALGAGGRWFESGRPHPISILILITSQKIYEKYLPP